MKNIYNKLLMFSSLIFTKFMMFRVYAEDNKLTFSAGTIDINNYNNVENSVVNTIWLIILGLLVIAVIFAAMSFMSAGGNPQKKEAAKKKLFATLIALVLLGGFKLIFSVVSGLKLG